MSVDCSLSRVLASAQLHDHCQSFEARVVGSVEKSCSIGLTAPFKAISGNHEHTDRCDFVVHGGSVRCRFLSGLVCGVDIRAPC